MNRISPNKSIAIACISFLGFSANAQWTGQSSGTDLTSPISRTGIVNLDGYNAAQIRLNSQGTYYGKIGNPSAQVWSLGWGTAAADINPVLNWTATGNVGVGTTTPAGKLDINAGGNYAIRTATSSRYVIEVKNTSDLDGGWWLVNDPSGSFALHENSVGDQFTIKPGGNVGIGTTSPNWKLHVKGAIAAEGDGASGYADINLKNGAQRWHISGPRFGEGNRLGFFWNDGTNYFDYLTISTGGNVGIGTASPDAKLAVKGTIHANEVKVDLSVSGPDYVFEKNYNLPSLEEIKTYIDQNKHLPEVPPAATMQKDGIQLGEMNMLLLKKIEELTLYVIELKNENSKLNGIAAEVADLRMQIESVKKHKTKIQ